MTKPRTAFFALDYDGCIFGGNLSVENLANELPHLINYIVKKIKKGGYQKIYFISASLRYNAFMDWISNSHNNSPSQFEILPKLVEHLHQVLTADGLKVELSLLEMLLPDVHGDLPTGSTFKAAKKYNLTDPSLRLDEMDYIAFSGSDKFILHYNILLYLSTFVPDTEAADVFLLDDRTDILDRAYYQFGEDSYLVPANINLNIVQFLVSKNYHYHHEYFSTIKGTGKLCITEAEWRKKSMALLLDCLAWNKNYALTFENRESVHLACQTKTFSNHVFGLSYGNIADFYQLYLLAKENKTLDISITAEEAHRGGYSLFARAFNFFKHRAPEAKKDIEPQLSYYQKVLNTFGSLTSSSPGTIKTSSKSCNTSKKVSIVR